MAFGSEPLGLGHEGVAPMSGINALIKKTAKSPLALSAM
jgi:hypothetical protein